MRFFALAFARITRWTALAAVMAVFGVLAVQAQDDPPEQAGRISALFGTVSIQPAGAQDWGQAYPNLPVGPGDRIYTDQDGTAEVQVGQTYLRIGPNSDVTLVGDDANGIAWGLAQGSVHIHSFGLWQGQALNVSTPNGDAQLSTAGEMRVDALPNQEGTIFSSFSEGMAVTGAAGFWQQMGYGQSLELAGINPVYPQWLQPAAPDYLDQWSQQRDGQIVNAASYRYVNPEVPGAADLDASGDWMPDSDYGPMWFPRDVPADWQPYHYGHWINRDPWGWVWVEDERWGYAPFHYGRWVMYRGRWGWVPGPREQRPVWSPALVVFAGGGSFGGVGVSAWFPLGPGEAYRPWYRCSPRYIDRVNITNIHESRVVHVQTTYVNIVNARNVTNVTYVNRTVGVSAMRPDDFAAGRSARQAAVQVDRRQFDRVQVVDRPAEATRQSFVTRPAARPVPVADKAPVFINKQGMQISARPGAAPVQPQVRQTAPPQPVTGRTVVAPPPGSRYPNANQPAQGGNGQPSARPVGRPAMPQDNTPRQFQGQGANQNAPEYQPQHQRQQAPDQQQQMQQRQPQAEQPKPTPPPSQQPQHPRQDDRQPPQPQGRPQDRQQDQARPNKNDNKDQNNDKKEQKKDEKKDDKKKD